MLHIENEFIRSHLLDGQFGLEKEGLRVLENGHFSHTPHPFPNDPHIVRDFCENQIEINTGVHDSIEGALQELQDHTTRVRDTLRTLPEKEYLWPFSNPPYIKSELDIPIAQFYGDEASKTTYREYLSRKYGRYKMTFSGIHFNFSFSEDLLRKDYELQENASEISFRQYKNDFYLNLAAKAAACTWLMIPITSASPVLDSSFMEKGVYDSDIFTGMASVRCSEMGYWNEFTPIFNYDSLDSYTDSIQRYVDDGSLMAASELYYPIRLKTTGPYDLQTLRESGAEYIELRMFDLNPYEDAGVDLRDLRFAHLFLVWLASSSCSSALSLNDQVHAVQNFKNASRYDLKTVYMYDETGDSYSFVSAAKVIIERMRMFYRPFHLSVNHILDYEYEKFENPETRYAWRVRRDFGREFVKKGLASLLHSDGDAPLS